MSVSDAKLEAMAQAIAEAFDDDYGQSFGTPLGWSFAPHRFAKACRQAARNALAVMEKSEL